MPLAHQQGAPPNGKTRARFAHYSQTRPPAATTRRPQVLSRRYTIASRGVPTETHLPLPHHVHEAYESYGQIGRGPLLLTCEHASRRVPAPLRSSAADRAALATHWGYDIGARTVTRALARSTCSAAFFTRYSRLVCDANRAPEADHYARTHVEGHAMSFNQRLTAAELQRRTDRYHQPYHQAISDALAATPGATVLSVHSFTPVWDGVPRRLDAGVLFDAHDETAIKLAEALRAAGLRTELNEPYSGKQGLMYSPHRHGAAHQRLYLELELNQALISDSAAARRVAKVVATALAQVLSFPL